MSPAQMAEIFKNSKEIECSNCSGKFFKQTYVIRRVSKVIAATPSDVVIPIPVWRCDDCGTPVMDDENHQKDNEVKSSILTDGK